MLLNTCEAEFGRSGGANIQIVSKSGAPSIAAAATTTRGATPGTRRDGEQSRGPRKAGVQVRHLRLQSRRTRGHSGASGIRTTRSCSSSIRSKRRAASGRPDPIRRYRLPTELERRGDFSQTRDQQGRPIFIKDPQSTAACNILTGGPGCFPGNIVPANRIDPNGHVAAEHLPAAQSHLILESTGHNYLRQETAKHPRLNHVVKTDWKPTSNASFYNTIRLFSSKQTGSGDHRRSAGLGLYDGTYEFSDNSVSGGWNHVIGTRVVNELTGGWGRRTEGFGVGAESDWTRLRKSDVGYTLGQFNPQLNSLGLIPRASFGRLPTTGGDGVDLNYPDRIGDTAIDYVGSIRDTMTLAFEKRTFSSAATSNSCRIANRAAALGGAVHVRPQHREPARHQLHLRQCAARRVQEIHRVQPAPATQYIAASSRSGSRRTRGRRPIVLTVDYGVRFLWYYAVVAAGQHDRELPAGLSTIRRRRR